MLIVTIQEIKATGKWTQFCNHRGWSESDFADDTEEIGINMVESILLGIV